MSRMVREWLRMLGKLSETTHEDREAIDREIEWITGVNCDEALERRLLTLEQFEELIKRVLKARRVKREFKEQVKNRLKKKQGKKKKKHKSYAVATPKLFHLVHACIAKGSLMFLTQAYSWTDKEEDSEEPKTHIRNVTFETSVTNSNVLREFGLDVFS